MTVPTQAEVAAQVERILASKGFSGSDPTRLMLQYLNSKCQEHPGEAVKEFELATNALGRGADYDPRTDSAVRVAASRLRSKLAEYYTQEGAQDSVLVSLPKGSYHLQSAYRVKDTAPDATAELNAGAARPGSSSRRLFLQAGGGLLVGAASGFFAGRRSMQPDVPGPVLRFWKHFVDGGVPIIVYSNPCFVGRSDTGLRLANPGTSPDGPLTWLYTGVGEVNAVRLVSDQLNAMGRDCRVKRARLFTWDDANASDLIFVGGQEQNLPMAQMPRLQKFNLKPESEEPYRVHGGVFNEIPAAGEEPFFLSSDDQENGVEYAVIALTRGVVPEKRVLVLAGVRTLGTEGAAAAVCNPNLLDELLRRLGSDGTAVPPFEALIELQVRGGTPLEARLRLVYKRVEQAPRKNG
jgi:hypothetical protein